VLPVLLTACFASTAKRDATAARYVKQNAAIIKEMAEYALLFCLENKINSFKSENIANRSFRRKMQRLGTTITVTYKYGGTFDDSTVTLHPASSPPKLNTVMISPLTR
jgi:hypothetical protein